jgi:hypothetical protein
MQKYLLMLVCLLALASCGIPGTNNSAVAPTPTTAPATPAPTTAPVTATPTTTAPVATFPPIGEWQYIAPWNLTQDDWALVLDIQQANSTTNVATMTSIVGQCLSHYDQQAGHVVTVSQPQVLVRSAGDSITGTDITVTAPVSYLVIVGRSGGLIPLTATFAGTINPDGSLALVSSGIQGLHDYLFTPTTNAVSRIQQKFQQGKCCVSNNLTLSQSC